MANWPVFAQQAPEMAEEARTLFYQYGVGLGFLASIRPDGGPRLHPICPIITDEGLYAFIVPSPKRGDLLRDGRFALHAFTPTDVDDECYLVGTVAVVHESATRMRVEQEYHNDPSPAEMLFEFDIERCMIARYRHRGDWPPTYRTWRHRTQTT